MNSLGYTRQERVANQLLRYRREALGNSKRPLKIALSMGTFNPVHLWHLQVAQCAWDQFGLDFSLFIPNGDPPHKKGVVSKERRYRWVKMSIAGNARFRASRIEIDRKGKSYSVDTLRQLKQILGADTELNLIIGFDNVESIKRWYEADEIFDLARLLIAPRDSRGVSREKIASLLPAKAQFEIIDCPDSDISSTHIREWLANGRVRSTDYLLANAVRQDIERNNPYKKRKAKVLTI